MSAIRLLIVAAAVGFFVGVVFIFVQPLFGMSPLTQRHAEAYMNLGSMSAGTAFTVAWAVHLFISVCYGLAVGIALLLSRNAIPFIIQLVVFAWVTTVIAPPANALLVRLIGSKSLPSPEQLPPLNFQLDAKLLLHILFFAAIAAALWVTCRDRQVSD
tara:strand:+ start:147 stop:620 length:474 start_codon:yes stop_codon:yes gene_type:complete